MTLLLSPRAIREAERCALWWYEHRPAASLLFRPPSRPRVLGLDLDNLRKVLGKWASRNPAASS